MAKRRKKCIVRDELTSIDHHICGKPGPTERVCQLCHEYRHLEKRDGRWVYDDSDPTLRTPRELVLRLDSRVPRLRRAVDVAESEPITTAEYAREFVEGGEFAFTKGAGAFRVYWGKAQVQG